MIPKIYFGPKGLKILLIRNNESASTTFLVLVKAGTDLEKKEENGIFHFIEHLYFKGTKKYPNPKVLLEAIDEIGGSYNAFTSHQYTGYYIKVLPEYSFKALDILSDILINPLFPEEEIEKERKVIYEEINLYQDTPSSFVLDLGFSLSFGDQPAGWPILGTKKTVKNIKREQIIKKVQETYSTKNTLIVISGKILQQNKLLNLIYEKFKNYNSKTPKEKFYFKPQPNVYKEKIYHKEVEQAHVFLGFPLPGKFELKDKIYDIHLLSLILGEKSSSRLWLKIREELGAAYYLRSHFIDYINRSLFYIHAGLNLENLELILSKIVEEINKLKKESFSKNELETSKAVFKSSLFLDLDDSLTTAFFYARQYLLENKLESPKEIENKIKQRKPEDIQNQINYIFNFARLKFSAILPKKIKINFSKIFKNLLK